MFSSFPSREPRRCRIHLAKAYPDHDAAWVERTTRHCFRHFGRMALWTIATLHRDPRELRRHIGIEGLENLKDAMRASLRGKGTVVFCGHFGNWELLSRVSGSLVPLTVVGRRLRNPLANHLVQAARTSGGARLLYQDDDVRSFMRELTAGRCLATLTDQDIPRLAGVFVPFFGDLARTPSAPAALALLTRSAVQPGFLYWKHGRWVYHVGPRRYFPRTGNRDADTTAITAWATAYEEALIRRAPEQWAWWHLRWRSRPPSELSAITNPAKP